MHIEVRVYAELIDLAGRPHLEVPTGDQARAVKDVVESTGIPHPEVGLVLVDGEPVGFEHQVRAGARVAVFPPFRHLDLDDVTTVAPEPLAEPRFVCDVHLGTLVRRLRLLGFDTWYRTDADDAELAEVATREGRILLTRDRGLLMRRTVVHGYGPRADDPDQQLLEVVARYGLARHLAPRTRCVRCNGQLRAVPKAEVVDVLPPRTRASFDEFARCEGCDRIYWSGAHADDLAAIVTAAEDATAGPATGDR